MNKEEILNGQFGGNMPLPTGAIIAYAGALSAQSVAPNSSYSIIQPYGWLVCNGDVLKKSDFPALYQAIGDLYKTNAGDDEFNLPNYKGQFLRMVNLDNGKDPDASQRTGGDATTGVGSFQNFALQTHAHQYPQPTTTAPPDPQGSVMGLPGAPQPTEAPITVPGMPAVEVSNNETRPVNTAVYYLIKAI